MSEKVFSAERLLELYDRVADAPDAIDRLRRFVLDLAVRGKLVVQDPEDEPACELLERIAAEKARMVKAGVIKRPKKLPPIEAEAFTLPANWHWVRIREVTSDRGQKVPDSEFTYLDVTAINKEAGVVAEPKVLSKDQAPSRARKIAAKGDVIYSCVRPYLLNVAVLDKDFDPEPIASTAFAVLNGHGLVLPWYLWIALRSPFMVECVEQNQRGQAYPAINDKDFSLLPLPLPPLAEQHHIVAKVDELMALLDRLETTRTKRETTRDRLTTASLTRLTAPDTTPENFPTHARFAIDNLPQLTTRPDQIKTLRKTILNLAVRGKLVELDPADQPVGLPDPEVPARHEILPSGWRYVRLALLLAENTRNGYSKRPDDAENGVPILRISAGTARQDGIVAEEEHKLISDIDDATRFQYGLEHGDLLACRFNGNKAFVGRLTMFTDYLGLHPIYPDKLIRVRLNKQLALPEFIRLAGESDLVRNSIEKYCSTTVGNWGISASNLKEVPFPLPSLAEQRQIVKKVDALMTLCDKLEAALTTFDINRVRLLATLLHDSLPEGAHNREAA